MAFGNIVDKLHDKHGLAHTGTTEQTDLTALTVRLKKVYHLYTGIEHFGTDGKLVEFGRRLMDRTEVGTLQCRQTVNGLADNVEQTAFDLLACRYGDRTVEIVHTHAALKSVGTFHGHTAHGVLAYMLLYLENQHRAVVTVNLKSRIDRRKHIALTFKAHVDHRTDYLGYFSEFVAHNSWKCWNIVLRSCIFRSGCRRR